MLQINGSRTNERRDMILQHQVHATIDIGVYTHLDETSSSVYSGAKARMLLYHDVARFSQITLCLEE